MNYAVFLSILNLILISRLRLILRDEGINRQDVVILAATPLLAMPFLQFNISWILLLVYLIAYPPLMLMTEQKSAKINRSRILFLLLHIVVVGIFCSPLSNLAASELPADIVSLFDQVMFASPTISMEGILTAQIFIFGLLMVLNEANIVLRYIMRLAGLDRLGTKGEEVDQKEYNTGRIIGLLERIFVFLFVLLNQFAAVGFILAAKGVARFQDFKSRTFAEYVLIGTLLSALLAMIVAFAVKASLMG